MRNVLISFFLALAATAARADTVILKEGGRLDGKVISATDREVVLDGAAGRVRIDASRVQSIDYSTGGALTPAPAPAPYEYRVTRRRRRMEPLYEPPQQALSIDFGLAAPLNSVNGPNGGSANNGDVGPLIGLQYLYYASPNIAWGLEVNYLNRSNTDSQGLAPNSYAHVYGDSLLLLADLKLSLTDRGPVRPFLLLAGGGHNTTTTINVYPNQGYPGYPITAVNDSTWGPAASVRLGLDFGFVDPRVFSIEAGWTGLWHAGYQPTTAGQSMGFPGSSGMLNYFTFAGRFGFTF
jgi:hypothetical protein